MSLINKILNQNSTLREFILDKKEDVVFVNIQDVADFFYFGSDQEVWDKEKDFPRCTPPWPYIYMEWAKPTKTLSKDTGLSEDKSDERLKFAHVITTIKAKANSSVKSHIVKDNCEFEKTCSSQEEMIQDVFKAVLDDQNDSDKENNLGWICMVDTMIFIDDIIRSYVKSVYYILSTGKVFFPKIIKNGQITDKIYHPKLVYGVNEIMDNREAMEEIKGLAETADNVMFLALSFCNCKNINLINPPKMSRQVMRQYLRTRREDYSYKIKTLEIKAMRSILNQTMQSHGCGIKKALHICRGHFKEYTEDNPLFGKYKGTYWVDMHVRGDAAFGEVKKDYKIKP